MRADIVQWAGRGAALAAGAGGVALIAFRGQLVLMAAVGIATGVAYHLLGLPSALLLGLIAGLFEVIPLIGPLLGAIPALLVAFTISPETAIAVAVVYVLIQLVEGNVLVPVVAAIEVLLDPLQARAVPVATDPRVESEPDEPEGSDAPEVPVEAAARVQA